MQIRVSVVYRFLAAVIFFRIPSSHSGNAPFSIILAGTRFSLTFRYREALKVLRVKIIECNKVLFLIQHSTGR